MTIGMGPIQAQRLVATGYRGFLRRNYLIQIVNDDVAKLRADASLHEQKVFFQRRTENWLTDGILPRATLFELLRAWIGKGILSSGPDSNPCQCNGPMPQPPVSYFVDVGITFAGFGKLESQTQLIDIFRKKAPAYAQGAYWRASAHLGDAGPSAPSRWDERYQGDAIHAVLVVHAKKDCMGEAGFLDFELAVLDKLDRALIPKPDQKMSRRWIEQSAILDDPQKIHFDMLDGLSAPRFQGIDAQARIDAEAKFNVHRSGELLLGHERNDKSNPWRVPGAYAQETAPTPLHATPTREAYIEFFRNGSFGVFRKMHQNVPEFNGYLKREAEKIQGARTLEYTMDWLKAKMLGRWPDGEPVGESMETADALAGGPDQKTRPIASDDTAPHHPVPHNRFSYKEDLQAFKCPYGAHIRRMNPRDDAVVPTLRRPLLRRGAPYGEQFIQGKNTATDRGLLGLFFCASIEEQFEHLLGNWANNNPMGMPFRQHGKDPIIGNHERIGNGFEIPLRTGGPLVIEGLGAFVQTRGTCYAFFPSLPSLLKIAKGRIATSTLFLEET